MKPVVAILGRPNVGKSTLFNRITQTRDAIVGDFPGVTRDRHLKDAVWNGTPFTVVDTGGFTTDTEEMFSKQIIDQIKIAIRDADILVLVMDGKSGVSPYDKEMLDLIRDTRRKIFYVVNKIDSPQKENLLYDFYSLGIDHIYSVSAEHGYGMADLMDDLVKDFPETGEAPVENKIHIAVIGRPNAGKSSFINRIIGEQRFVVSDIPGTTRDSIDTVFQRNDRKYVFIDTAGIRRKSKTSEKLEKFSIIKAMESIERCDVALIVIDSTEEVTEQDIKIAGYAYEKGCGAIFLLNKWDLVDKDSHFGKKFKDALQYKSKFLNFAPSLTISAKTGQRIDRTFALIDEVYDQYVTRIGTGELNRIFEKAVKRKEPSLFKGKRIKFYYVTQASAKPPTFVAFVNYPEGVHFSYERYLINQIREAAKLSSVPIRMLFRKRDSGREYQKFRPSNPSQKTKEKRMSRKKK